LQVEAERSARAQAERELKCSRARESDLHRQLTEVQDKLRCQSLCSKFAKLCLCNKFACSCCVSASTWPQFATSMTSVPVPWQQIRWDICGVISAHMFSIHTTKQFLGADPQEGSETAESEANISRGKCSAEVVSRQQRTCHIEYSFKAQNRQACNSGNRENGRNADCVHGFLNMGVNTAGTGSSRCGRQDWQQSRAAWDRRRPM